MPKIHPSSSVNPRAELADDVEIGPGCIIDGPAMIGAGTRLIGHVYVMGRVQIGRNNVVYPNACLGFEPQDRKYNPAHPTGGVVIGDNNILREGVTIHRATHAPPTKLGNDNFLMCNSHLGHDVVVGDRCTIANGGVLGGHVQMADQVTLGGSAAVHQFCRVGRLSMLSGLAGVSQDVPPFCVVYNIRQVQSLNIIGLRRSGLRKHIPALQIAFRLLYRSRHTVSQAVMLMEREVGSDPLCQEMIAFVRSTKRGVTSARNRAGGSNGCDEE